MKEVEKVSIGGYAFTIEKDASAIAQRYLNELENHYRDHEGGAEILEGIEERMAELLHERCGRDGIVARTDVESVMQILGKPEDIEAEDENKQQSSYAAEPRPRRRLYRDMSNKVVGGVCSGLGTYLNVDPVVFRILFAVFTLVGIFGHSHHWYFPFLTTPILIYIILWICIPAAKTAQQRWEQRGEDGTLNGIQRNVERGAREVGDAINRVGHSDGFREFSEVLGKVVGFFILLIGFAGLFTAGVLIFGSGRLGFGNGGDGLFGLGLLFDRGMHELYAEAPVVAHALLQPAIQILLLCIATIPFLGMLYGGLQLLFGFKPPKWHPGLVLFILWLLCIIAAGVLFATGIASQEILTI